MNCKPGDLAFVVWIGEHSGKIVEVLYLAPVNISFKLPNGWSGFSVTGSSWVVKFQRPVASPTTDGIRRLSVYAIVRDSCLRPLRGDLSGEGIDEGIDIPSAVAP